MQKEDKQTVAEIVTQILEVRDLHKTVEKQKEGISKSNPYAIREGYTTPEMTLLETAKEELKKLIN